MRTHRFGQKLKLPSTLAIKHQILALMFEDYRRAQLLEMTAPNGTDLKTPHRPEEAPVVPPPVGRIG
jgi:hypothetical protein